jgi:hypothetical protein
MLADTRSDTHRLRVFAEGGWGTLYDFQSDPHEVRNLWDEGDAQPLKLRLMQRLTRLIMKHAETSPRPTRVA